MFQYIEAGAPIKLYYSPGRDVAYCGLPAIYNMLTTVSEWMKSGPTGQLAKYMENNGVTTEQVLEAVELFGNSLLEEIKSGREAMLEFNSFTALPLEVKYILYSALGQIFIGMTLKGYKDVISEEQAKCLNYQTFLRDVYAVCPFDRLFTFKLLLKLLWRKTVKCLNTYFGKMMVTLGLRHETV